MFDLIVLVLCDNVNEKKQEEKKNLNTRVNCKCEGFPSGGQALSNLTLHLRASYHSPQGRLYLLVPQTVDEGVEKRRDGCGEEGSCPIQGAVGFRPQVDEGAGHIVHGYHSYVSSTG